MWIDSSHAPRIPARSSAAGPGGVRAGPARGTGAARVAAHATAARGAAGMPLYEVSAWPRWPIRPLVWRNKPASRRSSRVICDTAVTGGVGSATAHEGVALVWWTDADRLPHRSRRPRRYPAARRLRFRERLTGRRRRRRPGPGRDTVPVGLRPVRQLAVHRTVHSSLRHTDRAATAFRRKYGRGRRQDHRAVRLGPEERLRGSRLQRGLRTDQPADGVRHVHADFRLPLGLRRSGRQRGTDRGGGREGADRQGHRRHGRAGRERTRGDGHRGDQDT